MYDKVYIYEFEGLLAESPQYLRDDDYIGSWREGDYTFLFFHKPKSVLLRSLGFVFRSELAIRHEDWESSAPLHGVKIGRFEIHQPWNAPTGAGISIAIDPGMVFGSGLHSSTRGCLTLLDKLFNTTVPQQVLDLGTGTGILSIACLNAGAKSAVAVDINNLAVKTASLNRHINNTTDRLHIVMAKAEDMLHIKADLLIVNMHFAAIDPLIRRDDFYGRHYYLISGMIRNEAQKVLDGIGKRLQLMDSFVEDNWSSYLFKSA
jgi:ribosomal protein L11 methyltransferase